MLRTLDAALARAGEVLIGVLLLAASLLLFADVVARYGFNDAFSWAEELTRYAIVWMVFVGTPRGARKLRAIRNRKQSCLMKFHL